MSSLPSTQTALLATELNKPLMLTTTRAIPTPSPTQLLLRVTTTSPNPHDHKARDFGLFISDKLPAVLTNDVVGTIVALGSSATNRFKLNDRVLSHPTLAAGFEQTGLQQYALADADYSIVIPESISSDEAATLPTNIIASLIALFSTKDGFGIPGPWDSSSSTFDYAGTTVLIIGGGTNCGRFAVQLASLVNIGRIIVVGGSEPELKSLGATHIISRHGDYSTILAQIKNIIGDDLIYSYDTVNPPPQQKLAIDALSSTKKGIMVRLLASLSKGTNTDFPEFSHKQYEKKWLLGMSSMHPELAKPFWERVPGWLESGKIKATGFESVSPKDWDGVRVAANKVLDRYRDGERVAKLVIHLPQE